MISFPSKYRAREGIRRDLLPKAFAYKGVPFLLSWLAATLLLFCDRNPVVPPLDSYVSVSIEFDTAAGTVSPVYSDTLVRQGNSITVHAAAKEGWYFSGWTGDLHSTANPLSFVANDNIAIAARFVEIPRGLVRVFAAGSTFVMGSNSSFAAVEERPVHTVKFTRDFWISPFEVTQKEYAALRGDDALEEIFSEGEYGRADSLPVYNVSWYDAVLFCNERSKAEGYDTVYSYTAICPRSLQCPYILENLVIHDDRFGYRLPTEAEWEYAARAGSPAEYFWGNDDSGADAHAWFSANSAGRCRTAGKKQPNAFGLYDMAGNVAEWVNDWLGPYPDSAVIDPVGPRHLPLETFEKEWQRPIRGGSWDLGISFLRSSNRKGPYDMPAGLRHRAVGFRIALGNFSPDTSMRWTPAANDTMPGIEMVIAKSDLLAFFGTVRCKVVFTVKDKGVPRLWYIDYSEPDPVPRLITDSLPVYSPRISPDGNIVAYSSLREGYQSGSRATLRPLDHAKEDYARTGAGESAFLPRWWTDPVSADTFIVYTDGARPNHLASWETERTLRRRVTGYHLTETIDVLTEQGSFHGGLSQGGDYLATGYTGAYLFHLGLQEKISYFMPPFNGLDDIVQVCNVSINPGAAHPDRIMLLDFGTPAVSTIVGRPYELHEIIFICNSSVTGDEAVSAWYEKPPGFRAWNDAEWSNHPDYACAIATRDTAASLFFIDLQTSSYLEILKGAGVREPHLWIDPEVLMENPDPYGAFGQYDIPLRAYGQKLLAKKLKLFWKYRETIECVFMGSSAAHHGFDPSGMDLHAVNMATYGVEHLVSTRLGWNYAAAHASRLAVVCISLDPGFLDLNYYPDDPFMLGLYDSRGYVFDKNNNFWRDSLPQAIQTKIERYSAEDWDGFDNRGYDSTGVSRGWGEPVIDGDDYDFNDSLVQCNLAIIGAFGDSLASRGIHLLIVNFPQNPRYLETPLMGRYGPSRETFAQIAAWMEAREQANPHFHFYDFHKNGAHGFTDADAMDTNHLGPAGARKLAAQVNTLISGFLD